MVINLRQNNNDDSSAFGKYFAEVERKEPINLKGFCRHMTEHGKIASFQMCELVIKQMVECMKELVCQGQPVKIDGLGTFYPSVDGGKLGKTVTLKVRYADFTTITRSWSAEDYIGTFDEFHKAAKALLHKVDFENKTVRLLGIGISNLMDAENEYGRQLRIRFK